jgi:hypothetical protein
MRMRFNTNGNKATLSMKVSKLFRAEIESIAKKEGVKASNVATTFIVYGYKKYNEENKRTQPCGCSELEEQS